MRLTEEQQHTLRAAVDRIIPPADYPGAWQCGVGDYLARQFESDLRPMLDDYCAGLSENQRILQPWWLLSSCASAVKRGCGRAGANGFGVAARVWF